MDVLSDLIFHEEDAVNMAPSPQTQANGIVTYDELGKKTNLWPSICEKMAFHHTQPSSRRISSIHQISKRSGLGNIGRHGLLITPELGPRQRISALFISAENLPDTSSDAHLWISEFCASCGKCIKKCPDQAIVEEDTPQGLKTKIITDLCHGCTICMKECSFNRLGYQKIENNFHS